MSIITKALHCVKLLFDVIIVCGRTKAEHNKRLDQLCKRLHDYNVLINDEKSSFSVPSVDFVCHTVFPAGVQFLKSNIVVIVNLEAPTFCKKVRYFIGAANFYQKYIPHYLDVLEPLVSLSRNSVTFVGNYTQ